MIEKLKSRKFLAFALCAVVVLVNKLAKLGIDDEALWQVVAAGASYIVGEGAVDALRALGGKK